MTSVLRIAGIFLNIKEQSIIKQGRKLFSIAIYNRYAIIRMILLQQQKVRKLLNKLSRRFYWSEIQRW